MVCRKEVIVASQGKVLKEVLSELLISTSYSVLATGESSLWYVEKVKFLLFDVKGVLLCTKSGEGNVKIEVGFRIGASVAEFSGACRPGDDENITGFGDVCEVAENDAAGLAEQCVSSRKRSPTKVKVSMGRIRLKIASWMSFFMSCATFILIFYYFKILYFSFSPNKYSS